TKKNTATSQSLLVIAGAIIGWASAIFGMGGGALTVPFLTSRGLTMQQAAGTSSACGLPIAIAGSIGYLFAGWGLPELPKWSLGYIYLPGLIGIALTSTLFARVGVNIAHRLSSRLLQIMFAIFLICVGTSFLVGIGQ